MRKIRTAVPSDLLKKVRKHLATYGSRRILSAATGVDYFEIGTLKATGKAMPETISKLEKHFGK